MSPAALASDTCSRRGAVEIARRIETYWQERGYLVETSIEAADALNFASVFGVRSDLVNGLPKRKLAALVTINAGPA